MRVSGEMRWFWSQHPPNELHSWFCTEKNHPYKAGGGQCRIDEYFYDPYQLELGIKKRGHKPGLEIKGLVAERLGVVAAGRFNAPVGLWCKWVSNSLDVSSTPGFRIEKRRWLRRFGTGTVSPMEIELDEREEPVGSLRPTMCCNVELTRLRLPNDECWWTLGFEAFGKMEMMCEDIRRVALELTARNSPELHAGLQTGYPHFISHFVQGSVPAMVSSTGYRPN